MSGEVVRPPNRKAPRSPRRLEFSPENRHTYISRYWNKARFFLQSLKVRKAHIETPAEGPRHSLMLAQRGKGAYIALALLALLALGAGVFASTRNVTYQVVCDGQVLGFIKDRTLLDQVVSRILETEGMALGSEVRLDSKLALEKADVKDAELMNGDQLAAALKEAVLISAKGWVISVEGKDVVALASEDEARGVLEDLRQGYVKNLVAQGQATVEEVLIKERISISQKDVSKDLFRTKEEAAQILARGTDKVLNYVVQRGDSLWAIASANHMNVDDLRKANPQIQGDLIREGENLNLVVPNPYITLQSKEIVTYRVAIPFSVNVSYDDTMWPWQERVTQQGKSGQKEITEVISRENGKEISRTRVSEKVISYPVVQKVVKGTKQVPEMGSGNLVWPAKGSITSRFGWRWGSFHQGVDIGASRGDPILAADSGMVTFAGWNGGYGYLVKINHGNDLETWYAHMSKMAVSVGDSVKRGQVIGYVGSTGNSTGPHLHFEVHQGGVAKDPLGFYK